MGFTRVCVIFRVEIISRESEEKLNEYENVVYPKRIIERILCQIVGRFTRKGLVEENERLSAVGGKA